MLGKVITEHGQVVNNQDIMVVHLHLKEGETIPAHNHPGRQIFFTVVEGEVEVYLDESVSMATGRIGYDTEINLVYNDIRSKIKQILFKTL